MRNIPLHMCMQWEFPNVKCRTVLEKIYLWCEPPIDYGLWPDCPIGGISKSSLAGLNCLYRRRKFLRVQLVSVGIFDYHWCFFITRFSHQRFMLSSGKKTNNLFESLEDWKPHFSPFWGSKSWWDKEEGRDVGREGGGDWNAERSHCHFTQGGSQEF